MARRNRLNRAAGRATAPVAVGGAQVVASPAAPTSGLTELTQAWAPTVARIALGLVLLWFGVHELIQPSLWTGYVPVISQSSQLAVGLVLFHGWVLTILGVALALGVVPKLAAAVSAVLLLEIVVSLTLTAGFSDIVARDVGVFGLALAVFASTDQRLLLRT